MSPDSGPGENGKYPNGFEAAAFITSHMSMPIFSQIIFISFTNPMFTDLKVFSRSFVISAVLMFLTL